MKVGCFALIDPFSTLEHQLERIAGMGFKYADVTDSHPGSSLGRDYGFAATASLDGTPVDLKRMFDRHGLTATTICAHATLLDPVWKTHPRSLVLTPRDRAWSFVRSPRIFFVFISEAK